LSLRWSYLKPRYDRRARVSPNKSARHPLAKLEKAADGLRKEGWKWVELRLEQDHSEWSHCTRMHPELPPLTGKLAKELAALEQEYGALETAWDANDDPEAEYPERLNEISERIDAINEDRDDVWQAADTQSEVHNRSMRQLVVGWQIALALVAGIPILTTLGVYVLARFSNVFDAYAGERAKLLAQFHNLDRLVEQTERLTLTTETIKTQISDEVWDRQMRWNFKRDLYIRLLQRVGEFRGHVVRLKSFKQAAHKLPNDAVLAQKGWSLYDDIQQCFLKLLNAIDVAPLVVSTSALAALLESFTPLRDKDLHSISDAEIDALVLEVQNV
jgi:hypothetical protein